MNVLRDKNILITGATGGIGSGVAKLLSASGARLFITGRNAQKLKVVANDCGIPEQRILVADISTADGVHTLQQQYFSQMEGIDVLVNAAGIGIIKPVEQLTASDFMQSIQTNVYAAFMLVQTFLPAMKAAGSGLIINIPGVLGKVPMAGAAAYCASKYGLMGLMQCVREEVKRTPIRITNLILGGTNSAFWDTIDMKVQREKMISAEEAAKAIWFLCQQPAGGVVNEMVLQPFNHQAV
ncbi:MAG TPA: SDR family oxidoreductase [Ferruginibacter sp.]|nr:SDR family oxidoreductase [Ferruginibacter sp.]HMP20234.1 SDR family oxidoreductase [Ferruginibacter sp.]